MTAQAATAPEAADPPPATVRCVIVVDEALPLGLAANAAAMVALTLGATVDGLPGADLVDADGHAHPGLIPAGIPILAASRAQLSDLHARAARHGVGVIDFPPTASRRRTTRRSSGGWPRPRRPSSSTSASRSTARGAQSAA